MPADSPAGRLGRRLAASLGEITLTKVSEIGFANAQHNAELITRGRSIAALQDSLLVDGADAVVIAAGPSVHRHPNAGRVLKDLGYRGPIIATESAMSWLLRHGTVPDLVVTLDPHPTRIVRWFGDPELTEESLRRDDYYARQDMDPKFRENQLQFNRELLALIDRHGKAMKIAISSSASPAVVRRAVAAGMDIYWWNPMYDDYERAGSLTAKIHALNGLPCVNAGGNVGSACWVFAHAVLGKKRVALVGMDFSYYGDTPYTQTQYYREIVNLVGADRLDDVYVRIMNPHLGQEFYTDPAYLWYRDAFLEMAGEAGCETYNCTGGGILFGANIHWTSLTDFVGRARPGA